MDDPYEILKQKQMELARVRKEIDSLKLVTRLLADDDSSENPIQENQKALPSSFSDTISRLSDSVATNVDNLFSKGETSRSWFWGSLKRAR
jgi:hypothetical protein